MCMRKLIKDLRLRKEHAFETVYYQYYKLVYFVAFSMVKDREVAEEVVQDTFVKMMENIHQYRGKGEFKSWLLSITRNLARNAIKNRKRFQQRYSYDDELVGSYKDESANLSNLMMEIKECLDDFEAAIILYHVIYEFTFEKTASELNATISVVKKAYYKAIKILKEYYRGEKDE